MRLLALREKNAEQDFTSKLAGVVDAAVAGGVIINYRPFFTGEFARRHPEIW